MLNRKKIAVVGGGVLLSFAAALLPFVAETSPAKLASGRFAPHPIGKARRLDPHNTCAIRICCQDLRPRLPCKIFDSLPRTALLLSFLLPSLKPPIREVSRRRRQGHICSITFAFECPSGSPGRRILLFAEKDTVGLTWTS